MIINDRLFIKNYNKTNFYFQKRNYRENEHVVVLFSFDMNIKKIGIYFKEGKGKIFDPSKALIMLQYLVESKLCMIEG